MAGNRDVRTALTTSGRSPGRRRSQGEGAPEGDSPVARRQRLSEEPERENRITRKIPGKVGEVGSDPDGATAGAEGPMVSTNRALAFGEK